MKYFSHFYISEALASCTKDEIYQCITNRHLDNIVTLLSVLDQFRDYIGKPIVITSSFRNPVHNKSVGGSPTSQHLYGGAIDFLVKDMPFDTVIYKFNQFFNEEFRPIRNLVGQCIIYKKSHFIHIGLRSDSHKLLTINYRDL